MDPQRLKEAYQRLELLDDRLGHKIRPRHRSSFAATTPDQIEKQLHNLADYTLELKEIVRELFQAIAGRPAKPKEPEAGGG